MEDKKYKKEESPPKEQHIAKLIPPYPKMLDIKKAYTSS